MTENAAAKTYRARNLAEALASVKRELGPEALIISAKRMKAGGLLGTGQPFLEVKALPPSPGRKSQSASPEGQTKPPDDAEISSLQTAVARMKKEVQQNRLESCRERDAAGHFADRFRRELSDAAVTLRSVLAQARLVHSTGLPEAQVEVIQQLVDNAVEPGNAEALVRSSPQNAEDVATVRRAVAHLLVRQVRTAPPLQTTSKRRVAAFVGPTGVGKTTTIAKLAAACAAAGKRVGLITTDTYRIAAVNQLKCYADCIDLPFKVADSPRAVQSAVEGFSRQHIVLIDTPGIGPRSKERIGHIAALLSRAWTSEIHMVLATGTSSADLLRIRDAYKPIGVDRVLCTKLDEAATFGLMFNAPLLFHAQASYLCAGQRVPEDLEVATPERIARLILTTSHSRC